jgi:hypothetical protein
MMEDRCKECGCFLTIEDNSYLGQGGWVENEAIYCKNPRCKSNLRYGQRAKKPKQENK